MKLQKYINIKELEDWPANGQNSNNDMVLQNAIQENGIEQVCINRSARVSLQNKFSHEIKTGKITSQQKSGRCWMFAGLNLFRNTVSKNLGIDDFEFSQNHTMFYDKLEKANFFLESVIKTVHEKFDSRLVMWLMNDPLQDGGQWDMFVSLINKYGVVPKTEMPETYHSSNSAKMNELLNTLLRKWAIKIRELAANGTHEDELRKYKYDQIKAFYHHLTYFLGVPPIKFEFEYYDKDGKYKKDREYTPVDFYKKHVGEKLEDYVSIIHAPTEDKLPGETYTFEYLGNVVDGKPILYLNAGIDDLKKYTIEQLKDNQPVWFGCDVRIQCHFKDGLMDKDLYLYNKVFEEAPTLTKSQQLQYGDSLLTHAMVFTGVNIKDEKPQRWKVENSWGDEKGDKGFFVMSDEWFDQYNYQVVIHKKHLSEEHQNQLKTKPIVLPPWDPMGSLAKTK